MARSATLPILTSEPGLTHYFEEIRRSPMLERQEEYLLVKRWREHSDYEAAHKLVSSHLRLVVKIAVGYRGYGLPISVGRKLRKYLWRRSETLSICSGMERRKAAWNIGKGAVSW